MRKTGVAKLPLHHGRAPSWLFARMTKLAYAIVTVIVEDLGQSEFLRRVSDPFWFQALGCVLGYDWHSSGVTTVLTGVLKKVVNPEEHGLAICGGKGKTSSRAPDEIRIACDKFVFPPAVVDRLVYSSKMSAKIDSSAIQAGFPLYHHAFFLSEKGEWAVVQQGINIQERTARRYHWYSESLRKGSRQPFVVEPHEAIVSDVKRNCALNMTSKNSEDCRDVSTEIAKEKPMKTRKLLESVRPAWQKSIEEWISRSTPQNHMIRVLSMPKRVNWSALREAYEWQPGSYEELLSIKGVGPATVRGLALISEIIYGKPPSWKDPVKFSFAFGGKDGVPRPVDRQAMDNSIFKLEEAIQKARINKKVRVESIEKLRRWMNLHIHDGFLSEYWSTRSNQAFSEGAPLSE